MFKVKRNEIYSAPPIAGAIPPTEAKLKQLLDASPEDSAAHFSLANLYLRAGRVEESVPHFQAALAGTPSEEVSVPAVNTNLGLALALIERNAEALSSFHQAILQQPTLVLPYLHSSRIQQTSGDSAAARGLLERLMKLKPDNREAAARLGEIAEADGRPDEAYAFYLQAFESDPEYPGIRGRLAVRVFENGKRAFEAGRFAEAFAEWGECHHRYRPAFTSEKAISQGMSALVHKFVADDAIKVAVREYKRSVKAREPQELATYGLFCLFFFSVGIFPDAYEKFEELDSRIEYWRESLKVRGEHPYPHYRIALIYSYLGKFDEAEGELRICQDRLLPKKQAGLKLGKILAFVKELKEIDWEQGAGVASVADREEWKRLGFNDRFQLKAWRKTGMTAGEASAWRESGFTPLQASGWQKQKVEAELAAMWVESGFVDPGEARQWIRGGMAPAEAAEWAKEFPDAIDQAIQSRKAGFEDPEQARAWLNVFLFPWEAVRWHERGFTPDEAAYWTEAGIRDPFIAWQTKTAEEEELARLRIESDKTED